MSFIFEILSKNFELIFLIGGPLIGGQATAGHRKYSGILEKILQVASLVRSAFSVSIFGQKIRHNSTIEWQVQFEIACLSALVLGRSVDRT